MLKESGLDIKDVTITRNSLTVDDYDCDGLFEIHVNEWQDYKEPGNVIAIPAVRIHGELYMNISSVNNEKSSWTVDSTNIYFKPNDYIKKQIIEENILHLPLDKRKRAWMWFNYGVAFAGRGRIRMR